ncbi:MAG: hypothetical protein AB7Y46_04550 [Armatimonadota bacterium]
MSARIAALALIALCLPPTCAAQLTTAVEFGPPTIHLAAGDAQMMQRSCTVPLHTGETVLTMPLAELGAAAADVWLEAIPAGTVSVVAMETDPTLPGAVQWRLRAERDAEAQLTVTCPAKGLTWGIEYSATLLPEGGLDIAASLRVTNGLGHDLDQATLVGDGFQVELSLANGETVVRDLRSLGGAVPAEMVQRSFVYDQPTYGDSAVELLTFSSAPTVPITGMDLPIIGRIFGLRGPVRAGTVRLYAPAASGGELIATASVPWTPAGEPIELSLGPASGILVTRTRAQAVETNKRLDVNNKIAAYDLQETWELELRNLRETPVALLVREHHDGAWELEEASMDCEREDAQTLIFRPTVQPRQTLTLTYRIRHINRQP